MTSKGNFFSKGKGHYLNKQLCHHCNTTDLLRLFFPSLVILDEFFIYDS